MKEEKVCKIQIKFGKYPPITGANNYKMTDQDIKKFAKNKKRKTLTILALKDMAKAPCYSGYFRELTGVIFQAEPAEKDLIKQAKNSYNAMRSFEKKEGIILPKISKFRVKYLEPSEWLGESLKKENS